MMFFQYKMDIVKYFCIWNYMYSWYFIFLLSILLFFSLFLFFIFSYHLYCSCYHSKDIHGKNDDWSIYKNVSIIDTDLKIILLDYQNNYARNLRMMGNAMKNFDLLNYFNSLTKLFSNLYVARFLVQQNHSSCFIFCIISYICYSVRVNR